MKQIFQVFSISIFITSYSFGQIVKFHNNQCPQKISQYEQKLFTSIKVEETPIGNISSVDPYASSTYKDNTIGVQKIIPIVKLQFTVINRKENSYLASCTAFVSELIAVPKPYIDKLYAFNVPPEMHQLNEIHTIGLLNQYGSGKLMDMFQNTIMDDTNKVGYLFYFLKHEQFWRDNFMVLNKKTGKTSFYLSARDTNPFRKFTGSKAFREVGDIKELIDYRYGSVEKLVELLEEEQEEQACKCGINSMTEMEETIKQSWQIRMKYMPQDTIKAMSQFMATLQKVAALDSNQMRILNNNIQYRNDIPFKENCMDSDLEFSINHRNYGYFIKKSLTREQYAKCLKAFKQGADCAKRIQFYMQGYKIENIDDRITIILKE